MIMISDSGGMEWDHQLPLLFAYRSTIQESTRESPFFLLYDGSLLDEVEPAYFVNMEDYHMEFLVGLAKAKKVVLENVRQAQAKQKEFYDRQAGNLQYRLGERLMVYICLVMSLERTGSWRDLTMGHSGS